MLAGRPSTRIVPASGRCSPYSVPISVVLPAPFSPSRAWISPERSSSVTLSFATTPGYALVTPSSRTSGALSVIGLGLERANVPDVVGVALVEAAPQQVGQVVDG